MSGFDPTADPAPLRIPGVAANFWWRKNQTSGVLLNNFMILFILAPIGLVFKDQYALSLVIFSLMIPYGFLLRRLAVAAVRNYLAKHPEAVEDFRNEGTIL